MKQGPRIDCGESRLRSAPKIAGGSLSGGGSLGGPSLYIYLHSRVRIPVLTARHYPKKKTWVLDSFQHLSVPYETSVGHMNTLSTL